jgi:hypothetical protein
LVWQDSSLSFGFSVGYLADLRLEERQLDNNKKAKSDMKNPFLLIVIIFSLILSGGSVLAFMSSSSYRIDEDSLSFGEVSAERGNYFLESNLNNIVDRAFSKIQGRFDVSDNFIIVWSLIGFLLFAILLGVIFKIKKKGIKTKVYSKT